MSERTDIWPLLTVKEVAERLQMHPSTIRRLMRDGRLNAIKFGRKDWRMPESELKAK